MTFITLRDLTPDMAPSRGWLDRNGLVGILLPETPGHDEFVELVNRLMPGETPTLEIAHAEFHAEVSSDVADDLDAAFREAFDFSYEEIFINLVSISKRNVLWIPSEHKFYAVFGDKKQLTECFQDEKDKIKSDILDFANETFFNSSIRIYISGAVEKYFTL